MQQFKNGLAIGEYSLELKDDLLYCIFKNDKLWFSSLDLDKALKELNKLKSNETTNKRIHIL